MTKKNFLGVGIMVVSVMMALLSIKVYWDEFMQNKFVFAFLIVTIILLCTVANWTYSISAKRISKLILILYLFAMCILVLFRHEIFIDAGFADLLVSIIGMGYFLILGFQISHDQQRNILKN